MPKDIKTVRLLTLIDSKMSAAIEKAATKDEVSCAEITRRALSQYLAKRSA